MPLFHLAWRSKSKSLIQESGSHNISNFLEENAMNRRVSSILTIFFIISSLLGTTSNTQAGNQSVNIGAPGMVSYQGQVSLDGQPFNGLGHFKFAIIDPLGTISYWSNDGSSIGGSEPTTAISLPVTNGLFNLLLGDAGLSMPPLTPEVFNEPARLLRVWFSPDGSIFTQLAPDRFIASVPYALQAQLSADSVALNGHPADDFLAATQYLGRHWGARVDTSDAGEHNSITLGADGLGLIAYYGANTLKVLHCGNLLCDSDNIITTADSSPDSGDRASITIGADGLGLIVYYGDAMVKVLHCGNLLCNSGNTITTVDPNIDNGWYTSITIGVDGLGLISYYDYPNADLKVLHCGNLLCNSDNTITSVDTTGDVGFDTSITIGSDGLGLISYYDNPNGLKILHCGDLLCSSDNTITMVDSYGQIGTSITIGTDGLGLVSYNNRNGGELRVLHCGNLLCNNGNTITILGTIGATGWLVTSITIGTDGLGLISYQNSDNHLEVVHCGNPRCSVGNISAVMDINGNVGDVSSITIGSDGQGLISYYDSDNFDLEVVKLAGLGRR
jgi:hypothetical protein